MKILQILTRCNVGGPTIQVIDLHKELTKRNHKVLTYFGFVEDDEGKEFEHKAIDTFGLKQICFDPYLKREISFENDWKVYQSIKRMIKNFKPDIIHGRMSKASASARLAVLSMPKVERPKTVHTYHGHTFHSYWGRTKGFVFRNIERFLNKRTDRIIAISNSQYDDLVNKYRVSSKEQTRIIPLGFDLSELLGIEERKDSIYLNVGIIGRLNEIKNHELFFDFIRELKKTFTGKIIRGFIIGDGERKEYLKYKSKDIRESIYWVGWRGHNQVIDYLKELDIVVCTSKNEGTPVSLIEAMAAGRLVISTPVGGCADLLGCREHRGIYLYEDELKLTILALKSSLGSGYYKDIIKNARQYVKENHQLDRLVDDIENLYEEVLNDR